MKTKRSHAESKGELNDAGVDAQFALTEKLDGLLRPVESKKPVFNISIKDGCAVTACSKGDVRPVLQWMFDGLHRVLSVGGREELSGCEAALSMLLSTEPRTPIESLLISQMLCAHSMSMQFSARALNAVDSAVAGRLAERARGFMEVSCRQMETLMKLRGESIQQKVVVQHNYLQDGSQAVIGGNISGGTPSK